MTDRTSSSHTSPCWDDGLRSSLDPQRTTDRDVRCPATHPLDVFPLGASIPGGYRVLERVGSGGMSVVYRGWDASLDRPVAIRVARSDRRQGGWRARFVQESRRAATIRHPNVSEVLHLGYVGDVPFVVMDLAEGGDLRQWIHTEGTMPNLDDAFPILRGLCHGLQAIHDAKLVHRDIKPENVLLSERGTPMIADFGLCWDLTKPPELLPNDIEGTPAYLAPEVITNSVLWELAPRIDIYALGIIAFELLTGSLPFSSQPRARYGLLQAHVYETPASPSSINPSLGFAFDRLFGQVLAKSALMRFASPLEFLLALENARTRHAPKTIRPARERRFWEPTLAK